MLSPDDSPRANRHSLLIADDDPVVRSSLSMALEQRFDIVAVAGDGEDAVAKAAERAPDAALLDVDMPRGGGLRAVRGIAERSPGTALIVLSGDEAEGVVMDLLTSGAMAYCRKGGPTRQLADTIERSILAHKALGSGSPPPPSAA
jgi:DNA-binding NarL/FixJ family response regulator